VRLLFDENLSPWLVQNLADLYPGSIHVRDVGLKREPDGNIWEYAKANEFAIVTKDSDFIERSILDKQSPKIIWIQLGNCSSRKIENLLRDEFEAVRNHLEFSTESCLTFGFRR
jgi:predicted nuclease of predicted toxin-antitoxin system